MLGIIGLISCQVASCQITDLDTKSTELSTFQASELVMSMSQRSMLIPGYITELKALIARQAYNFWTINQTEPYVTHLNVYRALHDANKFLDFDSIQMRAYHQIGGHSEAVTSIHFGTDEKSYYSASTDGTILKWNIQDEQAIPTTIYKSKNLVKSIDLSKDGKWMIGTFHHTGMVLIRLEAETDLLSFEDIEPVQAAVFLPENQKYLVVKASGEMEVQGFEVGTSTVGHTDRKIQSLVIDKEEGSIYAGSIEGVLEQWNNESYFGYRLGNTSINCMDISGDGRWLAIGRERGDAVIWDLKDKRVNRIISGHQSAITDIEFSPDNEHLLTTSRDGTARIWFMSDRRKLPIILDDHFDWVLSGCFDPSGKKVITGSKDEFIRVWSIEASVLAERACKLLTRNLSTAEWHEFVGADIPYQKTCDGIE